MSREFREQPADSRFRGEAMGVKWRTAVTLGILALAVMPSCLAVAAGGVAGSIAASNAAKDELEAAGLLGEKGLRQVGIELDDQLVITSVENGGPAYKAGVKVGDRIDRIDGMKMKSRENALYLLFGPIGETVHVVVQRGDRRPGFTLVRRKVPRE